MKIARAGIDAAVGLLEGAERNGVEVGPLLTRFHERGFTARRYVEAYDR